MWHRQPNSQIYPRLQRSLSTLPTISVLPQQPQQPGPIHNPNVASCLSRLRRNLNWLLTFGLTTREVDKGHRELGSSPDHTRPELEILIQRVNDWDRPAVILVAVAGSSQSWPTRGRLTGTCSVNSRPRVAWGWITTKVQPSLSITLYVEIS